MNRYRHRLETAALFVCLLGGLGACNSSSHAPYLGASRNVGKGGAGGSTTEETGGDTGSNPTVSSLSGSALVGVFSHEGGMLVVDEAAVRSFSWDGDLLQRWDAPRPLLSADFDGTYLVISDSAALTTLDLDLAMIVQTQVTEACQFVVTVSNQRVICGPPNDWDRIFYTYDTLGGNLLGTSAAETYNGIPMRRVYGTDAFITVTVDVSPPDFYYYRVDPASNVATFIGDSPYHGDFGVNTIFGYLGNPATHLITHEGLMLRIDGAGCKSGVYPSGCLMKDGNLGTLPGETATYLGISDAPGNLIYTLVTTAPNDRNCFESACILQKVDVTTRTVLATRIIRAPEDMIAFYIVPTYDGRGVFLVASGRSIYQDGYNDTLPYSISYFDI